MTVHARGSLVPATAVVRLFAVLVLLTAPITSVPAAAQAALPPQAQAAPLPSRAVPIDSAAGPPTFEPVRDAQAAGGGVADRHWSGVFDVGPPPAVVVPSFGGIFKEAARDFTRLPSRETALWLGLGAAVAAAGHSSDARLSAELGEEESLGTFLEPGAVLGSAVVHLAGGFASYAIGRGTDNRRLAAFGSDLVRAQLVTQGMTQALKFTVGRTRPDGSNTYSFPSGHTSTMFASATVVRQHFGWKWGAPAYAAAVYVAASRVQMQKHYLSDVAFGAALGIIAGRTVTIAGARFGVEPMFAPGGGAGIAFRLQH